MTLQDRKQWAGKIVTYILAKQPVTIDQLEDRAVKQHGMSLNDFGAILMQVERDGRVSATLTTTGVVYKEKREYVSPLLSERERGVSWLSRHYPWDVLGESPFKVCMCLYFRNDDSEVWEKGDQHRGDCDSILSPELYQQQNPYGNIRK